MLLSLAVPLEGNPQIEWIDDVLLTGPSQVVDDPSLHGLGNFARSARRRGEEGQHVWCCGALSILHSNTYFLKRFFSFYIVSTELHRHSLSLNNSCTRIKISVRYAMYHNVTPPPLQPLAHSVEDARSRT